MSGALKWYKVGSSKTKQCKVTQRTEAVDISKGQVYTRITERSRTVRFGIYEAITKEDKFPSTAQGAYDSRITIPTPLHSESKEGQVTDFRIRRNRISGETVWTMEKITDTTDWVKGSSEIVVGDLTLGDFDLDEE